MKKFLGVVILIAGGALSLPMSAMFFDGPATENYVLPIAIGASVVLGIIVAQLLPLAAAGASPGKKALVGGLWGLAGMAIGLAFFWFALNGLTGA